MAGPSVTACHWARRVLCVGLAAIVLAFGKLHASVVADPPYDYTSSTRFAWSVLYVAVLVVAAYGAGLPDLTRSRRSTWMAAVSATVLAGVAFSLVQLVAGQALLPRFVVFGAVAAATPWLGACGWVAGVGRTRAQGRDRVLFVGEHAAVELLRLELGQAPERPAAIVGFCDPSTVDQVASRHELHDLARSSGATVVVLDRTGQADEAIVTQVATLHAAGLRVRTLSLFYEEWLGKLPAGELQRISLMFDIGELHRSRYGRAKRLVDVVLAVLGLPILVAVVPAVWITNRIANPGPLLFEQVRVGHRGREFRILKLRSMLPAAAACDGRWTAHGDVRVTPFGRVLRRSHLDELPQLLNILKGDLSIVGPRPEQPQHVAELRQKLPFYDYRHLVRPGLTGWAQVKYGYAGSDADALEKLQYEFFYLRRQGLSLDARIVGRTIRSVVRGDGR